MSGDVMHGTCDICGKSGCVERSYYHYGFKCECHSPEHFSVITYCKDCAALVRRPAFTKATFTDEQAQYIAKAVAFYEKHKEEYKNE